jgi:serine/threonine protein kinase
LLSADKAEDAARRARFLREAQAASSLNHPNIVTIYEINSDQGIDFITMELVHGRTLHQVLQEGRLPPATAVGTSLCKTALPKMRLPLDLTTFSSTDHSSPSRSKSARRFLEP